jgi:hypothetical protein
MLDACRIISRRISLRPITFQRSFLSSSSSSLDEIKPSPVLLKTAFKNRLQEAKNSAVLGGGQTRINQQHKKGKLTARERLLLLLDEASFQEYDQLKTHRCQEFGMNEEYYYGDGVVTGHGTIHGRKVNICILFILFIILYLRLLYFYLIF